MSTSYSQSVNKPIRRDIIAAVLEKLGSLGLADADHGRDAPDTDDDDEYDNGPSLYQQQNQSLNGGTHNGGGYDDDDDDDDEYDYEPSLYQQQTQSLNGGTHNGGGYDDDDDDDDNEYDYEPSLYQQQNQSLNGGTHSGWGYTALDEGDHQKAESYAAQETFKRLPFVYPRNHRPPTLVTEDTRPTEAEHLQYQTAPQPQRQQSYQLQSSGQLAQTYTPEPVYGYGSWADEAIDSTAFLQYGQLAPAVYPPAPVMYPYPFLPRSQTYSASGYFPPLSAYTAASTASTNTRGFPLPSRSVPFTMPMLRAPMAPAPASAFSSRPPPQPQWHPPAPQPQRQPPAPQIQRQPPAPPVPQPKKEGYVGRADKGPHPPSNKYPSPTEKKQKPIQKQKEKEKPKQKQKQSPEVFYPAELLPFGTSGTLEVCDIARMASAGKGKKKARACPMCMKSFKGESRLRDHLRSPVHKHSAVRRGGQIRRARDGGDS